MDTSEKAVICTIVISVVAGLAVSCALTANADPGYPHALIETVEPIDISTIEPIEIMSETVEAVEIEEEIPFGPAIAVEEPVIDEVTIEETEDESANELLATEPPEPEREVYLTDRERQLMAQLVHAEAGNESYDIKRLVVDVVFNRVDSPIFPNTIEEVIYQRRQFSVVRNGAFDRAANQLEEDDWLAVDEETYGRLDYGILYFNDDSIGGCANGKGGWKVGRMWFAY